MISSRNPSPGSVDVRTNSQQIKEQTDRINLPSRSSKRRIQRNSAKNEVMADM